MTRIAWLLLAALAVAVLVRRMRDDPWRDARGEPIPHPVKFRNAAEREAFIRASVRQTVRSGIIDALAPFDGPDEDDWQAWESGVE